MSFSNRHDPLSSNKLTAPGLPREMPKILGSTHMACARHAVLQTAGIEGQGIRCAIFASPACTCRSEREDEEKGDGRSPTARSQVVERVKATDSFQNQRGSHFARLLRIRSFSRSFAHRQWRFPCKRRGVKTEHLVARTFSQSC